MVKLAFEKKYIAITLELSKDFFLRKKYKLTQVVENSRDGCYVEYKKGACAVCIYFCPTNDVIVSYKDSTLRGLANYLFNSKSTESYFSLHDCIKFEKYADEYDTYVSFLNSALSYIRENRLLEKKYLKKRIVGYSRS